MVPLRIDGRQVADYQVAPEVDPTLSPRPFLDPVRTLGGTEVSDRGCRQLLGRADLRRRTRLRVARRPRIDPPPVLDPA
jgi:hypothetical protein